MSAGAPARPYEQRELVDAAISRFVAGPLFLTLTFIAGDELDAVAWAVVAIAATYGSVLLAIAASPRWGWLDPMWFVTTDLIVLGTVVIATGGPQSQVSLIFLVYPLVGAILFPVRFAARCQVAAMLTFAAASLPFVVGERFDLEDPDLRALLLVEASMAWIGLVTLAAADIFWRRSERIGRLSTARQRLLADAMDAEDRARRRLADSLHDDALQVILAAGQDLDAGADEPRLLLRARDGVRLAVRKLRETIRGLNPAGQEIGGLARGVDSVVEAAAERGGFSADVRVDPLAAGVDDPLLIAIVRELATNVAKHAEARAVAVQLDRGPREVTVTVADDGRGMTPGLREAALDAGHIGLASCRHRVEGAGGTMEIASTPGEGTVARVSIPARSTRPAREVAATGP